MMISFSALILITEDLKERAGVVAAREDGGGILMEFQCISDSFMALARFQTLALVMTAVEISMAFIVSGATDLMGSSTSSLNY